MFMAYVFYLLDMWLKSCSFQISFIPQRTTSYNILNYPLVPCLMCMWKTYFIQMRNVDIHLVEKFGNGLEVKFVRTPTLLIFPLPTFCLLFWGVHHMHTLHDIELHTYSNQIWINLTPCWSVYF